MMEQGSEKLEKPKDNNSQPIRILYIEDVQVIRDMMVQLLEAYGYKVAAATNGQEGVEMALQWQPDLVLMDLRMPVMDGYQAIREIRHHSQTQHIPIFVVSAWSSKTERDQARLAGADEFFVKPIDFKRLNEAIKMDVAASGAKSP